MDDTDRAAPHIAIIGAGKVGTALGIAWAQHGVTINAVYSRDLARAESLGTRVNARVCDTPHEAASYADLALLTVPDDAIRPLAESLAVQSWHGKAFVHTSGAHSLHSLDALAACGAQIGSLHPAMPFADPATASVQLIGASFAIEASHEPLRLWLEHLVTTLNGRALLMTAEQKALYHAALVIASNYTVTLYAIAESLLQSLNAPQPAIDSALGRLVSATVENIGAHGIPKALTGPLTRADVGTLQAHLEALHTHAPHLEQVYRLLARLSYPMLEARGVDTQKLDSLLNPQDSPHADNHS